MHPGCAQGQGQGQRSRYTRTFLDSRNELHWFIHLTVTVCAMGWAKQIRSQRWVANTADPEGKVM